MTEDPSSRTTRLATFSRQAPLPIVFRPQLSNCVLVLQVAVPSAVLHPEVVSAAGGRTESIVQVADVAIVDFPGLQVSHVATAPQRYALTVAEQAGTGPSERLVRVAEIVFRHALAAQVPIALGLNFVRVGLAADDTAGETLLRLLRVPIAGDESGTERRLVAAGIKLIYEEHPWRATLNLEPDVNSPNQLVAAGNFHIDQPPTDEIGQLLAQVDRLYESFIQMVEQILGVRADADRS